jgi:hypothetical protein
MLGHNAGTKSAFAAENVAGRPPLSRILQLALTCLQCDEGMVNRQEGFLPRQRLQRAAMASIFVSFEVSSQV